MTVVIFSVVVTGLVVLVQYAFGVLVLSWLDTDRCLYPRERLVTSLPLGLVTSGFLLTGFLLLTRSWPVSTVGFFAVVLIIFLLRQRNHPRSLFEQIRTVRRVKFFGGLKRRWIGVFLLSLFAYLVMAGSVLVRHSSGVLAASSKGAFQDVAYHLNIIGRLRVDPFVLEHPVAAGERLNYPFIVDLLTAFYQNLGMPVLVAWNLPVLLLVGSTFFLVLYLGFRLFDETYYALALILIALFGSGLSFVWYFSELGRMGVESGLSGIVQGVVDYPIGMEPYWRDPFDPAAKSLENMFWMAPVFVFFTMQRAFAGGVSLAIAFFIGLECYRDESGGWRWLILWALLPLTHTHTFLAVSFMLPVWFLVGRMDYWSWFKGAFAGSVVVLPQVLYLFPQDVQGGNVSSFIRPWFGWIYCKHTTGWFFCELSEPEIGVNFVWFLVQNFGFVFLTWSVVLAGYGVRRFWFGDFRDYDFYVFSSLVLFLLPMFVKFQPWSYDNNKLLFYWWVLATLVSLVGIRKFAPGEWLLKFLLVVFVVGSVASGVIEVGYRLKYQLTGPQHQFYETGDRIIAEWILSNTPVDSRFVAESEADQFIPMLTGRALYKGFGSWLWSQGKDHIRQRRQETLKNFFRFGHIQPLCEREVRYVLWSDELEKNHAVFDRDDLFSRMDRVYRPPSSARTTYTGLYKLRCQQ